MGGKFFIIDGHSYLYQTYYAIRNLTGPEGQPVNAIYGFINILQKIMREEQPDYIAVTFDSRAPTFRHKKYDQYKATRKPMPDDLRSQEEPVKEIIEAYRIPVYAKQGVEADDLIGTIITDLARKPDVEVYVISRDRDIRQLLREGVYIYDTKKGKLYGREDFLAEYGFEPEKLPDMIALAGDSSDNIPGVKGIGPQGAKKLLSEWGSLESILANVENLDSRNRKKIIEHKETALLSKDLATIRREVDMGFEFADCRRQEPDSEKLLAIFQRYGFKRFLGLLLGESSPQSEYSHELADTEEKFEAVVRRLERSELFAFDTETTHINPHSAELVGISFAVAAENGAVDTWYIPVRGPEGANVLDKQYVLERLKRLFETERYRKIGQNIKYDALVLRYAGIELRGYYFNTMIAGYLIAPDSHSYGLDGLALQYLGRKNIPISDLIGKGKKHTTIDTVALDRVCEYACEDAFIAYKLMEVFEEKLKDMGLWALFTELEMPVVEVLTEMEFRGVCVDRVALAKISQGLGKKLTDIVYKIHHIVGEEFNLDSPKQLAEALFERLGFPIIKKTASGAPSTDHEVLDALTEKSDSPLPPLLIEHRKLSKLKSTYADALGRLVNERTGRLHTSFNQTGTATGRLSSSEPNLQNIPVREKVGEVFREVFVPGSKEFKIVAADYSQIELRFLAHFSGDPELVTAFERDEDIHQRVAASIYSVSLEDVSAVQRRHAKAVNFGLIYGLSAHGLTKQLGISHSEAGRYIEAYFSRYKKVKEFTKNVVDNARETGYTMTILNRRRYIPGIHSQDIFQKKAAERIAVNSVLQGSAADLIKTAMVRIYRRFCSEDRRSFMMLQVHDELLFEAQVEELDEIVPIIREEMTTALSLSVPLKVDIGLGDNWLEAKS